MIQLGLLWFDDDPKRPLSQKIALAAERYRERLGYLPEVCQLHPAQAAALATQKASALPALRLVPDASLRPNYFLVGTEDERAAVEPTWAAALDESHQSMASPVARVAATRKASHARVREQAPQVGPVAAATSVRRPRAIAGPAGDRATPPARPLVASASSATPAMPAVSVPLSAHTAKRRMRAVPAPEAAATSSKPSKPTNQSKPSKPTKPTNQSKPSKPTKPTKPSQSTPASLVPSTPTTPSTRTAPVGHSTPIVRVAASRRARLASARSGLTVVQAQLPLVEIAPPPATRSRHQRHRLTAPAASPESVRSPARRQSPTSHAPHATTPAATAKPGRRTPRTTHAAKGGNAPRAVTRHHRQAS